FVGRRTVAGGAGRARQPISTEGAPQSGTRPRCTACGCSLPPRRCPGAVITPGRQPRWVRTLEPRGSEPGAVAVRVPVAVPAVVVLRLGRLVHPRGLAGEHHAGDRGGGLQRGPGHPYRVEPRA